MPSVDAADRSAILALRRDRHQQLVVVSTCDADLEPIRSGLSRRRRERNQRRRDLCAYAARAAKVAEVLDQPVGDVHAGAHERRPQPGRDAAAAAGSARPGNRPGPTTSPWIARSPSAPSPIVPVTQIAVPGPRAGAADHCAWRNVADRGQRKAERAGAWRSCRRRAARSRTAAGPRPAPTRTRRTRRPAFRAGPRASAGRRAGPHPWRRGRTGSPAAACARRGRPGRPRRK